MHVLIADALWPWAVFTDCDTACILSHYMVIVSDVLTVKLSGSEMGCRHIEVSHG